jgi:hypothetical protein
VRLLPPEDELPDRRLDELDLARDPPVELDRAREPLDLLDDALRLPLLLLPVLDRRDEALVLLLLAPLARFFVEPRPRVVCEDPLRPGLLDLARLRPPCCERLPSGAPSSWSSSPFPRNFFATPTAAGTATPMAAPATTFLPVDIPSFSLSLFSISTSISVAGQVPA